MEQTQNTQSTQQQTGELYIAQSDADNLPSVVRNGLKELSAQKQEEFMEEYKRKQKNIGIAYLLWFILGLHYAYFGKWGLQILFWITLGAFGIWWIIDAIRMPSVIQNYNKDIAVNTFRLFK